MSNLHEDVLWQIYQYLPIPDLRSVFLVERHWYLLSKKDNFWKDLYINQKLPRIFCPERTIFHTRCASFRERVQKMWILANSNLPEKGPDHYTVLGVSERANRKEILIAFRDRVNFHATTASTIWNDEKKVKSCESKILQCIDAYSTLSDKAKRDEFDKINVTRDPYDQKLIVKDKPKVHFPGYPNFNFNANNTPQRRVIRHVIPTSLESLYNGRKKPRKIRTTRQIRCDCKTKTNPNPNCKDCDGQTIKLNETRKILEFLISSGSPPEHIVSFKGEGGFISLQDYQKNVANPYDVEFVLSPKRHARFILMETGKDLMVVYPIQSGIIETELEIRHLDDHIFKFTHRFGDGGIQKTIVKKVIGEGMILRDRNGKVKVRGNLFIKFVVKGSAQEKEEEPCWQTNRGKNPRNAGNAGNTGNTGQQTQPPECNTQ